MLLVHLLFYGKVNIILLYKYLFLFILIKGTHTIFIVYSL